MNKDYEDFYDGAEEEYYDNAIEELRGTVGRGPCIYCGAKNAMIYEGNICFVCTECNTSIHEDLYYRWLAGGTIQIDDEW